jgi:hypothetical protein
MIETKEKLLEVLIAKPVPTQLFRDEVNGRLYRSFYAGMGEHFAVASEEMERLVEDLLLDGTLVITERLVGCPEMRLVGQDDGTLKTVATREMRRGRAIELRSL